MCGSHTLEAIRDRRQHLAEEMEEGVAKKPRKKWNRERLIIAQTGGASELSAHLLVPQWREGVRRKMVAGEICSGSKWRLNYTLTKMGVSLATSRGRI